MKIIRIIIACMAISAIFRTDVEACTGITLKALDGSTIVARTTEWGGSILNSQYVIVPRGHRITAMTAAGSNAMSFTARYGFAGITVEQEEFIVDGMNEAGLAAGLFFFPGYGKYEDYCEEHASTSLPDMQFVSWVLASFASVEETVRALESIHIVALSPEAQTVHWRVADKTGREIVIEIVGGKTNIYENRLGVLTNSPGFDWHILNLNNYVNLKAGTASAMEITDGVTVSSFGAGSSMLGIPGDVTPPSRFIRAAFYKATAPRYATGSETVLQCFQILNNFDIPIGVEHSGDRIPEGLMSATQWTTASDMSAGKFYYRTWVNSAIRCIDLSSIRFDKVRYQAHPLDKVTSQPVEYISPSR